MVLDASVAVDLVLDVHPFAAAIAERLGHPAARSARPRLAARHMPGHTRRMRWPLDRAAMKERNLLDERDAAEQVRDSGVFVDIFDATGPLGEAILTHRQRCQVGEVALWYARAEELAALKAFSDRPRDFEDLVALITHAELDTTVVLS